MVNTMITSKLNAVQIYLLCFARLLSRLRQYAKLGEYIRVSVTVTSVLPFQQSDAFCRPFCLPNLKRNVKTVGSESATVRQTQASSITHHKY
eukprot:5261146-Amphidinium_carterae.1